MSPSNLTPALIEEISAISLEDNGCTIHPTENYASPEFGIFMMYHNQKCRAPTVNQYGPPMAKCLDLLARISVERNLIIHVLFRVSAFCKVKSLGGWKVSASSAHHVLWITHNPADMNCAPVCQPIDADQVLDLSPDIYAKSGVHLVVSSDRRNMVIALRDPVHRDIRMYSKSMYSALTMLSEYAAINRLSVTVRVEHRILHYIPDLTDWMVFPSAHQGNILITFSPNGKDPVVREDALDASAPCLSSRADYMYALAGYMRSTGRSLLSIINDPTTHPSLVNTLVDAGVKRNVAEQLVSAGLNQLLL